ncbi:MAG: tyrosine-type recombinase/integrase [Flavobacteriales bacterium]|nr:tyrosine-type recombinase/integrase [Flavobacteriales bacterium]
MFEGWGSSSGRYNTTSISKVLHKACRIAGVEKKTTFHTLSHSFATHLLEQGTSIYVIQRLLGHSHISTSSMYVHVQQHSLDQVISPIDAVS